MSKKLPLEIQRNYSIKDKGAEWHLSCLVCDKAWKLQKPGKGEKIHGGNILHLLDHAASHPLAEEAEVVEEDPVSRMQPHVVSPPQTREEVLAGDNAVIKDALLKSESVTVEFQNHLKHGHPTARYPNPYRVELTGNSVVKVSHFRDPSFNRFRLVEKVGDSHVIVLYASNPRHAGLVGQRLIEDHLNAQRS